MAVGDFGGLKLTGRSSSAVTQKRAVGFDDAQVTSAGVAIKGIANTNAPANVDYTMTVDQTELWTSGAAVSVGARLTTDSQGRCVAATTGNHVSCRALTAASAAGQDVLILFSREGVVA